MVAGAGYDACREDRRYTLVIGPAGRAGNAKNVPRSTSLLADLTVRQFRSICAAEPHISGHPDPMRISCGGRRWNNPRIGAGVRRTDPYLATANAASRQRLGRSTIARMRPFLF